VGNIGVFFILFQCAVRHKVFLGGEKKKNFGEKRGGTIKGDPPDKGKKTPPPGKPQGYIRFMKKDGLMSAIGRDSRGR